MKWPHAYSTGFVKMGTVTGRFPSQPETQELTPDDVRKLQEITPDQARGIMRSVLGDADFAELERQVLASMTKQERRQAIAAAYGAGQIKQALIAGEYPPPDVLAELDRIGVRSPRTPVREEPTVRYDAPAWKPTVPGEEPPF